MNLPNRLAVLSLVSLPILTGCMHSGSTRTVTQSDNGSTITLNRHDRLEIQLPGNPSTGYSWQTVKINSWVLAPLGRPTFVSGATGTNGAPLIGAGGTFTMSYEAVGVGTCPIELSYTRPWIPETSPSQTFQITVNVSK